MRLLAEFYFLSFKVYRRILMYLIMPLFKLHGKNFVFDPFGLYSYNTISVGDDVSISKGATFSATDSYITIGNKVMFGPNVAIMGGDHNFSQLGRYMYDVHEKKHGDDLPVIIEDDVWVGCNVTILKGVTIGRGSIIAAGSVVIKSIPPYSIAGGVPARVIKPRWPILTIIEHEALLYPPEKRMTESQLSALAAMIS